MHATELTSEANHRSKNTSTGQVYGSAGGSGQP